MTFNFDMSHEQELVTEQEIAVQQKALALQQAIETDIAAQNEAETESDFLKRDAEEPPEKEDNADSDGWVSELISPWDGEWQNDERLIRQLPHTARPNVRFQIREDWSAVPIGDPSIDPLHNARLQIVNAIIHHLRQPEVEMKNAGDWYLIPAIDGDDGLIRLVAASEDASDIDELVAIRREIRTNLKRKTAIGGESDRINRVLAKCSDEFREFYRTFDASGSNLKEMAIVLPNGDVLKVQALLEPAGKGKRAKATRAGALRASTMSPRPTSIAGEEWDAKDWRAFKKAQRESTKRTRGANKHD